MGTRELLILILGLAVVAVILRGLYVALHARRSQIRLAIDRNIPQDLDLEELEMSELPNGGARVVGRSLEKVNQQNTLQNELDLGPQSESDEAVPILLDAVEINQQQEESDSDSQHNLEHEVEEDPAHEEQAPLAASTAASGADSRHTAVAGRAEAERMREDHWEDTDFDDEGSADYETAEHEDHDDTDDAEFDSAESSHDEFDDFSMTAGERIGGSGSAARPGTGIANRFSGSRPGAGSGMFSRFGKKNGSEDGSERFDSEHDPLLDDFESLPAPREESNRGARRESAEDPTALDNRKDGRSHKETETDRRQVADINQARESRRPANSGRVQEQRVSETNDQLVEPSEVLVVNVMSREGELFRGAELLQVLLSAGLRHGEMNIFHKHVDNDAAGPVIFSVANILNPGTFDLDSIDEFSTRGVSLFLAMPSVISNRDAFEDMLRTAQQIRGALDGELRDDHRSVMTAQTIEHYRQRIQDYELRKLKAAQVRS